MLDIPPPGSWQCQQQITTNNIEKGEEEEQSKWRSAPSRCDAVFRNFTVHIIFARIVVSFWQRQCQLLRFFSILSTDRFNDLLCVHSIVCSRFLSKKFLTGSLPSLLPSTRFHHVASNIHHRHKIFQS